MPLAVSLRPHNQSDAKAVTVKQCETERKLELRAMEVRTQSNARRSSWAPRDSVQENVFMNLITTLHQGFQELTNPKSLGNNPGSGANPDPGVERFVHGAEQSEARSPAILHATQQRRRSVKSVSSRMHNTQATSVLTIDTTEITSKVRCERCSLLMVVPSTARKVRCCQCGHVMPGVFKSDVPAQHSLQHAAPSQLQVDGGLPPGPPRYRVVGPTSECIHLSLAAQGFVRDDHTPDWALAWGSTLPAAQISQMRAFQRHNHIPGWSLLNNKGVLGQVAERTRAAGVSLSMNVPKTFVLPGHADALVRDAAEYGGPYILKPIGGTRGRGIRLLPTLRGEEASKLGRVVVQRYIKNPHLIQGRKYDLRLYVTATSTDPMRVYIHEQGYARLCSESFDLSRPQDLFRHVTNSNLQKFHSGYDLNNQSTSQRPVGNKWHISAVREEWRRSGSDKIIWDRLQEAIVRAFVMFESIGFEESRRQMRHRGNCFCLFGVDVLLDAQLKPWLLELNGVPSTGTDSTLDIAIKSAMIGDLLSLLGLCSRDPAAAQRQAARDLTASLSKRQGKQLAPPTMHPPSQRPTPVPSPEEVRRLLGRSLQSVQQEDVDTVLEWEEEKARRRGWVPVYPAPGMGKFLPMLPYRRSNQVMLCWATAR